MEYLLIFLAAIQSYLLGSINFAIIFSKLFLKKDVRDFGSGNAGMTNVLRVVGVVPGILTFLCDVLKGAVACYIGKFIIFDYLFANYQSEWFVPNYGALLCGIFCMLGHVFPLFFGFKGGKAVAISVGIFAIINWKAILLVLTIFVIMLLISRIISISSLTATAVMPVAIFLFHPVGSESLLWVEILGSLIMVLIIYLKYIENIKILIKVQEKPIFGKGKKG